MSWRSELVVLLHAAERVRAVVDARYPELRAPRDVFNDVEETRPVNAGQGTTGLPSPTFAFFTQELITRFREFERDRLGTANELTFNGSLHVLNGDHGDHGERFILSGVDEDIAPRAFPIAIPHNVIAFLVASLPQVRSRVRVLGQLVRVYSDAVGLAGDRVGLRAELIRSLGRLFGAFRDAISALSDLIARSSSQPSEQDARAADDDTSNSGDCADVHASPSGSLSASRTVGDSPGSAAPSTPPSRATTKEGSQ